MTHLPTRATLVAVALLAHGVTPAPCQWTAGAGVRAPRFSGAAEEPGTGRSLRPYRPTMWALGIDRAGRRVGVGLRVHYASSSLALEGQDALVAVKDAISVYGVDPELSVRVTTLGPAGVVRAFAGPLLEVWELPEEGSNVRVGLSAALGLEVPFGGRWAGSARIGAAVMPSPFGREDLDPAFEPRTLWRREVAAELRYRL
ncbi:MAG: hypothetical protein ABIY46_12315 [Gemmatimonadales bacterium]